MNILQINTADQGGGAEGSALNLFRKFRELEHGSWLAVGRKYSDDPDIVEIPREPAPGLLHRGFFKLAEAARAREPRCRAMRCLARICDRLANPERLRDWRNGREEVNFPGCRRLLTVVPVKPDIIHCHNLHGWYFDLRLLPELSRRFPLILNMRDTWLVTGHCAYFMSCSKWINGCGDCPRLDAYPPVRKNSTTENWHRKQEIYANATLFVTAPSRWLIEQAKLSMLNAVEYKVIPNGIDTTVFKPGERAAARHALGIPLDAPVAMFATASPSNIYKDPRTLAECVSSLAARMPELHFLCVGANPPNITPARLTRLHYVASPAKMAECYRAADVFIHTARAEAFGKTVTEAMACGTPVAASNVGGIPDQIIPGQTGFLAPLAKPDELADCALEILRQSPGERANMRRRAAERGMLFSLDAQANAFLNWYPVVIDKWRTISTTPRKCRP